MDAQAPFAIEQKDVTPSPCNPRPCLPQLSRAGVQQAAAMEAWPMAVVLVGDSEGECRQPAAAGHLPIRSFFFPSPSSLASRWRHPEREDHGGPEEDARRRRPHHRRTSTRGGELVGASLHALSAGLVAGNDMQVPDGAPSLPLTAPPPLGRAGLGHPLLSAVLQRFMDAARWWGGEGVVAGRRWALVGRWCNTLIFTFEFK
jgi:hypothetical protein